MFLFLLLWGFFATCPETILWKKATLVNKIYSSYRWAVFRQKCYDLDVASRNGRKRGVVCSYWCLLDSFRCQITWTKTKSDYNKVGLLVMCSLTKSDHCSIFSIFHYISIYYYYSLFVEVYLFRECIYIHLIYSRTEIPTHETKTLHAWSSLFLPKHVN